MASLSSSKTFEVEKRSVLYKSWLYVTHNSRFKKSGDYFSFSVAGLNFFLIRNKKGEVNAFHNVCRHRAYPVVKKEQGSSIILGCKYHGWSYNSDGQLTKAPQFDDVEGFDKSQNSLFKINTQVTDEGLVFINFDSTDEGPISFNDWYKGAGKALKGFDFNDYEHYTSFELDGQFNWKALLDSSELSKSFNVENQNSDGSQLYLFPINGIKCFSNAWYSIRALPVTATRTLMQYDIYKKKGANQEEVDKFVETVKSEEQKDLEKCEAVTELTNGPTQTKIQGMISEHLEDEKKAGVVVNPAFVGSKSSSETGQMLDKICQELECGSQPDPVLAW